MDLFTLFRMMGMAQTAAREPTDIDWGNDYAISLSGASLVPNGMYFYSSQNSWYQRFDPNAEQFTHALVKNGSTYYFGEIVYGMAGNTVTPIYTHVGHDVEGSKTWTDPDGNPVQLTLDIIHNEPTYD